MRSISLKIPEALDARLTAASKRRRMTRSELARQALELHVGASTEVPPGSFADLAADLAGSVDKAPADLSFNHDHLSGYGR